MYTFWSYLETDGLATLSLRCQRPRAVYGYLIFVRELAYDAQLSAVPAMERLRVPSTCRPRSRRGGHALPVSGELAVSRISPLLLLQTIAGSLSGRCAADTDHCAGYERRCENRFNQRKQGSGVKAPIIVAASTIADADALKAC